MRIRSAFAGITILCLGLAACDGPSGTPVSEEAPASAASPAPPPQPSASPSPQASATATELDFGALEDRENPDRLLRFYVNAIHAERWDAAAAAWSRDADITAETLKQRYGGTGTRLAIGKGDAEGAAGSLYYEAPITAQGSDGQSAARGTIVLRRVNDVPGASEEQLNWRIERSSLIVKR